MVALAAKCITWLRWVPEEGITSGWLSRVFGVFVRRVTLPVAAQHEWVVSEVVALLGTSFGRPFRGVTIWAVSQSMALSKMR